jgi:hypothetical protein
VESGLPLLCVVLAPMIRDFQSTRPIHLEGRKRGVLKGSPRPCKSVGC